MMRLFLSLLVFFCNEVFVVVVVNDVVVVVLDDAVVVGHRID